MGLLINVVVFPEINSNFQLKIPPCNHFGIAETAKSLAMPRISNQIANARDSTLLCKKSPHRFLNQISNYFYQNHHRYNFSSNDSPPSDTSHKLDFSVKLKITTIFSARRRGLTVWRQVFILSNKYESMDAIKTNNGKKSCHLQS